MKKMIGISFSLLILVLVFGWINNVGFTEADVIPGRVSIIQSEETVYGKAVLYENLDHHTFGVARLEKKAGFLYRYGGGANGYYIEKDKPFEAAAYGSNDEKDSFTVGIKMAKDSGIKYVALGNYMEEVPPNGIYELHLDQVKENSDDYHVKEVFNDHVLFVVDEYTEDTWTIRGFDEHGALIADKRFAEQPRYLK